ncbi:FkbM family methyltransferase [Marinobacter koreensis]|uniref:FkbM family methyltransferase n=1 Tax=Marinobacter koreensis TaxID=335974 RepID=A0ABW0RI14_9GAMM|nr:FkbM family methyltransferase [Marinobacter koreensis]MCK7547019.1 FkbM family methyltransferase [Marinobacter koreensis]
MQLNRNVEYARRFCHDFINSTRPKYILGTNDYAVSVSELIDIDGYINDFTQDCSFNGKPIVSMSEVPETALVLMAVVYRPKSALQRVKHFKFDSLDYFSFVKNSSLNIKDIEYWKGFNHELKAHQEYYSWLRTRLADEESKDCLDRLIAFRTTYDIQHMEPFDCREAQQYFEPFLNLNKQDEIFVDVGGYDGQTTFEFIKQCPDYKTVHYFEPARDNMEESQRRLTGVRDIVFHPEALSRRSGHSTFVADGSSSRLAEPTPSDVTIETARLDDIIEKPVSFIKMDIEGHELSALEGAELQIRKHAPRLAICVYHRAQDLREIPELVLSYYPYYSLYLRHYMEGFTESVMYFIPPPKQH